MNPNAGHSATLKELVMSFFRSRNLIYQMTKRDVIGRYRGSLFGLAWSFFNPLIMLAVYTLVFSAVFKAKWGVGTDSKTEFALALFIGMIVHGILAESLNRASTLMLGNINYIKKVIFPIETLCWVAMGSTLFHALISVGVWLLFYLFVNQTINWTVVFFPIILLPLILFSIGVAWFLASLGVFIRDIGQITSVLTTMLLFMSPVFYPASRLPEPYRTVIFLNPLTFIIEQSRDVLMWGKMPDPTGLGVSFLVGTIVAWAGFAWFQKTRKGFADVL